MHLGREDRTGVVYALEEAADGRGVGEVRGSRGASGSPPVRRLSTMSGQNSIRPWLRKRRTWSRTEGSPFFGGLGFVTVVVVTGRRNKCRWHGRRSGYRA
jgi:hypothetical protein